MSLRRALLSLGLLVLSACTTTTTPGVDHHQHLFSPAVSAMLTSEGSNFEALDADELVRMLDDAKIDRAVVLSVAYMYGSASRNVTDEYDKVRAANDWTASEAARYPKRLTAFCGFNPLKPYALEELARCAAPPLNMRGIKMHFGNSDIQLDNPAHVEQLQKIFRAANERHMAIVVHMRASISRKRPYGRDQAKIFLEQLLPAAPDVVVQVAHLAGTGPGYADTPSEEAFAVFADAIRQHDPRTRNLWFDLSGIVKSDMPAADAARFAENIRKAGLDHVLYGSDAARGGNLAPREAWAAFRKLPLTDAEFKRIARNVAPYLR